MVAIRIEGKDRSAPLLGIPSGTERFAIDPSFEACNGVRSRKPGEVGFRNISIATFDPDPTDKNIRLPSCEKAMSRA